jgi:glycosyltransferase involved in cell wall biosynthesis
MEKKILKKLKKEDVDAMQKKHGIEPMSDEPWIKGFTGGSDDHAGLFLGMTYTNTPAKTMDEYFENVVRKQSIGSGRNNNYQGLAFTIYKIAYEYINLKTKGNKNTAFSIFANSIFGINGNGMKENIIKSKLKYFTKKRSKIHDHLVDLIDHTKEFENKEIDTRFEVAYNDISNIADELVTDFLKSLEKKIMNGDFFDIMNKITSLLPSLFISVPFFTSMSYSHNSKHLLKELKKKYHTKNDKKILWFTDTITDLNGVAETLKKIGWVAARNGKNLVIAGSLEGDYSEHTLPPNYINLPFLYSFTLPYYATLKPNIPSVLKSLKIIEEMNPDEIYISTPGPVGLLGLLAAKLLNIKATGIYHTDFTFQLKNIADDQTVANLTENFTRWFYDQLDEIRVPSNIYIDMLAQRGFKKDRMKIFRRGIDGKLFSPINKDRQLLRKKYDIENGDILLFAGRISKDKNLDFLLKIYREMKPTISDLNLVIAGDGPYLQELKDNYANEEGVIFTGQLNRSSLPELYSIADVFVFPSNTDTFGMVVLEAQACGLPAVVSDQGGPGEIIIKDKTGYALPTINEFDWRDKINHFLDLKQKNLTDFDELRKEIRHTTLTNANWDNVLDDIFSAPY